MAAINELAARGGPSPWRQALHMLWLALSGSGVRPEEYFTYALWRKDWGRAFLKGFLPNHRKRAFNASLLMPERGLAEAVMNDKLATEALLLARGLPVSRSRAVWQPPGAAALPDLPGLKVLESPAALAGFLSDPANLPSFGKPRSDSFARGATVIEGLAAPDTLRFLTGETAPRPGAGRRDRAGLGRGLSVPGFLPMRRFDPRPHRAGHGLGADRDALDRARDRALVCRDPPARPDGDA